MINELRHLLAVVNHQDDGEIVLQKARKIAEVSGADLHVIKVIHEGFVDLALHGIEQRQQLKTHFMDAAKTLLDDLISPVRESTTLNIESEVVWQKNEYQGIIDAAKGINADLVIKATRHSVPEIIRTPQDWHLLRHSRVPVMLVKPISWDDQPLVLAAIDVEDPDQEELNERILHTANQINKTLGGQLYLINAFPSVEHWVGPITLVIDFDRMRQSIGADIKDKLHVLADKTGIEPDLILAAEGKPQHILEKMVRDQGAEILIMGTSQRKGPGGIVIGNTSESILHHVNSDVLVLN